MDYWHTYLWRDAVTKVITVNFIVWLVLSCGWLFFHAHWEWFFALPSSATALMHRPWTLLTYMFTQADFLHLLVNMLWFMLFGRLLEDMQGERPMYTLYIYGGLAGAAAFIGMNIGMHTSSVMIGASCAVLAIVGAVAVLYPRFSVNLLFFGPVKIIWLVVGALILFAISWASVAETVAHVFGLLIGLLYGYCKKKGIDITAPVTAALGFISSKKVQKARPLSQSRTGMDASEHQELDALLAKVGRSGYGSLSPKERQRLFDLSQKIKR